MPESAKSIAKLLDQSLIIESKKNNNTTDNQEFNISDFI